MKRFLLNSTLILTLAAAAPVFGQQATPSAGDTAQQPAGGFGHKHAFDPNKAAAHLSKRLGLSTDQTAKLEPILADSHQKIAALRGNTSLTPDQRRDQVRAIHKDTQSQLATVLTPDQMQQLKSMRRGAFRGRHHGQSETAAPPSAS